VATPKLIARRTRKREPQKMNSKDANNKISKLKLNCAWEKKSCSLR